MSGTSIDYVKLGPRIQFKQCKRKRGAYLFAGALERIGPGLVAAARTAPTLVGNVLMVVEVWRPESARLSMHPDGLAFDIRAVDPLGRDGSIAGATRVDQIWNGAEWAELCRDSLPDYWDVIFNDGGGRHVNHMHFELDPLKYRLGDYTPHLSNLYHPTG